MKKFNKLEFTNNFDAIICLNADIPDKDFFDKFKIPLLASDGAAILLYRKGIMPDKVIGDMDSFSKEKESKYFNKEKIIKIEEQETNDFEKCLKYAISLNYKNILIVGFHGGLLEHSLNNWSVFRRYSRILNTCIYDKGRYGISVSKNIYLNVSINEIISIIPQPEATLITKGLKWELKGESLSLGKREGARNKAISESIVFEILSGEILLFMNDKLPYSPIMIE